MQYLGVVVFFGPLLRLVYFDTATVELVLLGIRIPREHIYLPVLGGCLILGTIVFFTIKFGRYFCAFLCPVHLYLEHRYRSEDRWWHRLLPWVVSVLAAEAVVSFVFSYRQQWAMYTERAFPQPILVAHTIILGVMIGVFYAYEERFCHSACPYAVLQNVCRCDDTVVTVFDHDADRCVDCTACDRVCPMKLDVREQSTESFCTNCTLCIEACSRVLGEGREVMTQMREHELPEEESDLPTNPR
ncbi:MAG: 4Fe-4S binding protein [bacterium]|nr:4Fe-4S binding protein [bacterium]